MIRITVKYLDFHFSVSEGQTLSLKLKNTLHIYIEKGCDKIVKVVLVGGSY